MVLCVLHRLDFPFENCNWLPKIGDRVFLTAHLRHYIKDRKLRFFYYSNEYISKLRLQTVGKKDRSDVKS